MLAEDDLWVAADVAKVAFGVLHQLLLLADPDGFLPATAQVVHDDAGDFTAFSDARAVAHEETSALLVLQELLMGLAGVDHHLKLGVRQRSGFDQFLGKVGGVGRIRRGNSRQGGRFHQGRVMRLGAADLELLRRVLLKYGVGEIRLRAVFDLL